MKNLKAISFLTLLPLFNSAQVFSWAHSGNCTAGGNAEGMAVATDASANAYIAGYYGGSTITFGTYTLASPGGNDFILAKYDSNGNIQWAKSGGGVNVDYANTVATDASGNVFVTGNFNSPTMVIGTYTLVNTGGFDDIFLAKYDTNGNVLWAVCAGDTGTERSNGVSTDAAGNAYITGSFSSYSFAVGSTTLTNSLGNNAVFIVKYNASGIPQWGLAAGGGMGD